MRAIKNRDTDSFKLCKVKIKMKNKIADFITPASHCLSM